jgi:hypothetical protein
MTEPMPTFANYTRPITDETGAVVEGNAEEVQHHYRIDWEAHGVRYVDHCWAKADPEHDPPLTEQEVAEDNARKIVAMRDNYGRGPHAGARLVAVEREEDDA